MKIRETREGMLIQIKVKPGSKREGVFKDVLEVKDRAESGRANMAVLKFLKKLTGREAVMVSGFKSREKLILIRNASKKDLHMLAGA